MICQRVILSPYISFLKKLAPCALRQGHLPVVNITSGASFSNVYFRKIMGTKPPGARGFGGLLKWLGGVDWGRGAVKPPTRLEAGFLGNPEYQQI
jgi:hypothetical protein